MKNTHCGWNWKLLKFPEGALAIYMDIIYLTSGITLF